VKLLAYCKDCDARLEGDLASPELRCPGCSKSYRLEPTEAIKQGTKVDRCALCGYERFHLRKEFPRRLGLAIVLGAAVLCFVPNLFPPGLFFMPLIIASVVDLGLYQVLPWKTVCYVCETEYRGVTPDPAHGPYDLETATECKRLRWPKPA
jgi:hypothetical protein